jgi:hypothetical protein
MCTALTGRVDLQQYQFHGLRLLEALFTWVCVTSKSIRYFSNPELKMKLFVLIASLSSVLWLGRTTAVSINDDRQKIRLPAFSPRADCSGFGKIWYDCTGWQQPEEFLHYDIWESGTLAMLRKLRKLDPYTLPPVGTCLVKIRDGYCLRVENGSTRYWTTWDIQEWLWDAVFNDCR